MNKSKKLHLNKKEIYKVAKGAGIAALGAGLIVILDYMDLLQTDPETAMYGAMGSALVNLVMKFVFKQGK